MVRGETASRLKVMLQNNPATKHAYSYLKDLKDRAAQMNNVRGTYSFDNRSRGTRTLCVVLAGYKPYLFPYVFPRLLKYAPQNMDICIATAGKREEPLRDLCKDNGWSYLSTKENNVSLVQNIAFSLFPQAKMIFKLDEDIFVTEGFFEKMLAAYDHAYHGQYLLGALAPLIPVNGFGHVRILERYGLLEEYASRFQKPLYMAGPCRQVENNAEAAKFLWGKGGHVPSIDRIASDFSNDPVEELPCAIRFSIGAILFERAVWEDMGYFEVYHGFVGLGMDERQLCTWCTINSRPIMISQNAVVGHFAFGSQTSGMRQYLESHPEVFEMHA